MYCLFQSTPPRRGRQLHSGPLVGRHARFNPRPREGGDPELQAMSMIILVSIHAPAKGATTKPEASFPRYSLFQSTPPRRGRRAGRWRVLPESQVSIHAPAKGATRRHRIDQREQPRFNPRPREGGDERALATGQSYNMFQSTPPRRGRRPALQPVRSTGDVSIHAPAKGATPCRLSV